MELTYQGLRIVIPFEGAIGVEAFTLEAYRTMWTGGKKYCTGLQKLWEQPS